MTTTPNFNDGTWTIAGTIHFGGDPNGDILWQNIANQSLILWQQDGATTTAVAALPSLAGFDAALVGDFDKDGIGDALLRNAGTLQNKLYLSTTGTLQNVFNSTWTPSATTDLTNDGSDEIIWVNPTSTLMNSWVMDSGNPVNQPAFSTGYANGDSLLSAFDGTGTQSFKSLWLDVSAAQYNLTSYSSGVRTIDDTFFVTAGNIFQSDGDFNGDGFTDFFFRDETGSDAGSAEVVFTNSANDVAEVFEYQAFKTEFGTFFDFVLGGDFDGDGRSELLRLDPVSDELTMYNVIGGTVGNNETSGSDENDAIDGGDGDDSLFGKDGDDLLMGANGEDLLVGGDGDDFLLGEGDDDRIFGGNGDDEIDTGAGDDYVHAGAGDDLVRNQGSGTSVIEGGEGDDYLLSDFGGHLRGGPGNDVVQSDTGRAILQGGAGDDQLFGSASPDYMFGGDGDDYLIGGNSVDTLFGGNGSDILIGPDRDGTATTNDVFFGGAGKDYFHLGTSTTTYYAAGGFAIIEDFLANNASTSGDHLVLQGTSGNYIYNDIGSTIEIRFASTNDLIAQVNTTASATAVLDASIFIG